MIGKKQSCLAFLQRLEKKFFSQGKTIHIHWGCPLRTGAKLSNGNGKNGRPFTIETTDLFFTVKSGFNQAERPFFGLPISVEEKFLCPLCLDNMKAGDVYCGRFCVFFLELNFPHAPHCPF